MVKKFDTPPPSKDSIQADVIILGCTLPGIVTAHKLKRKFGNSMDIMVIDLPGSDIKPVSKSNVVFQESTMGENDFDEDNTRHSKYTARELLDNVARIYLLRYAKEFKVPLPESIIYPEEIIEEGQRQARTCIGIEPVELEPEEVVQSIRLQKLFQYPDGKSVQFLNNLHDFEYLSFLEKFELNQYQSYLDVSMKDLFQSNQVNFEQGRKTLLFYDQTTMEKNICDTLLFPTSRDIMRTIVRLVCGVPAHRVSLLFYLHQCYRTSSTRNHLGGLNTRFREKLLGHCRKRLSNKLLHSIADITLQAKSIKEIRTYSEQVILETIKGTTYICNLLAMALRPEQLSGIRVEGRLLSSKYAEITREMTPGRARKFNIQYRENFWSTQGYSGDIFSMRGPIIWAMERPRLSTTGSQEKYSGLIGYLRVRDDGTDSREAVLEQLVNLFGSEAADPVSYRESAIPDIYVPRCGDYVALHKLTSEGSPKFLEWAALDIFADGDVAAALEAGHTAYLHMLGYLRPQAQTYDDIIVTDWPTILSESPMVKLMSQVNVITGIKITVYTAAIVIGITLIRSYMRS